MKNIMIIGLILFCAVGVGIFAQETGVITELTGTVEIKPAGNRDFIPAKAGDSIVMDTIISTGLRSTALIRAGSTILTIRPLTRLSFSEISSAEATETINVTLQTGRVRADVKPPAGTRATMTIQSPVATASVRGTSFEFNIDSITVLEGSVAFIGSKGKEVLVGSGSASNISENNKSTDPLQTFTENLRPAPPAGDNTGFRIGQASAPRGTFELKFDLR